MKNRTCLNPMLTSQGGTVPGSHCQQGLCFHFLGLSPESGDGDRPLPRNSLWHISFLPSPKSGPRDEARHPADNRQVAPLALLQLVLILGLLGQVELICKFLSEESKGNMGGHFPGTSSFRKSPAS